MTEVVWPLKVGQNYHTLDRILSLFVLKQELRFVWNLSSDIKYCTSLQNIESTNRFDCTDVTICLHKSLTTSWILRSTFHWRGRVLDHLLLGSFIIRSIPSEKNYATQTVRPQLMKRKTGEFHKRLKECKQCRIIIDYGKRKIFVDFDLLSCTMALISQ